MGKSTGMIALDKIDLNSVQQFYKWLQGGDNPEKIEFQSHPRLTSEEAFSVIYYLQEELEVLPDCYEQCRVCECLYDSYNEGTSINKDSTVIDENGNEADAGFPEDLYGMYCDSCRPD